MGCRLVCSAHVSHIVSVCYFHLCQLHLIRRFLTADTAHVMVRALIHSCLDYCNGLLSGLPSGQIARLQGVLRSAARLVLSLSLCPVVRQSLQPCTTHFIGWIFHNESRINLLCWCTSVYMLWHQTIWQERVFYLTRACVLLSTLSGRPYLRSSEDNKLFVPRSLTASMGPRVFCSSGPTSWNTLPAWLRHS